MGQYQRDESLMAAPGWVTLICPTGAEAAAISHGPIGYRAYMANPADPETRWLVELPMHASVPLLERGGFRRLD